MLLLFELFRWLNGKEPPCQCRSHRRCGFNPCTEKIPWRRKWQPIPVFLPGKSYGERSLGGYSSWGCKESDTTEHALSLLLFTVLLCWVLCLLAPHAHSTLPHSALCYQRMPTMTDCLSCLNFCLCSAGGEWRQNWRGIYSPGLYPRDQQGLLKGSPP